MQTISVAKKTKQKPNKAQANCAQIDAINMQDARETIKHVFLSYYAILQNVTIGKYLDFEHLENLLSSSLFNFIKISVGLCVWSIIKQLNLSLQSFGCSPSCLCLIYKDRAV